jgi:isopenicillin N synthase-like dioxygenase
MKSLPILDFSKLNSTRSDRLDFLNSLRSATHEVGFFYLIGHGIHNHELENAIKLARDFFALPEQQKLEIENTLSPHFRGYTRVGGELTQGKVDWREQIDIGVEREPVTITEETPDYWVLQGPNLWPAGLPELRTFAEDWIEKLSQISIQLLRAWSEALGSPPTFFDEAFASNPSPLMKIVRYPGVTKNMPSQGVGAHKDLGVLTLLYVESGKEGLQVELDGEWIDAPPMEGAFVVNIGEMLEIATQGYLKATLHRVVSPSGQSDRISIPFFFSPALDSEIPTMKLPPSLAAKTRGVSQDPNNELHSIYGENWLKSRVRAHPNVVEAHHPHLLEGK